MTSPCVRTCKITSDVCDGCGRTLDEIKLWPIATQAEQQIIIYKSIGRIER
jgi:predicted Fe-S protein YdhL (DUF1289 family)